MEKITNNLPINFSKMTFEELVGQYHIILTELLGTCFLCNHKMLKEKFPLYYKILQEKMTTKLRLLLQTIEERGLNMDHMWVRIHSEEVHEGIDLYFCDEKYLERTSSFLSRQIVEFNEMYSKWFLPKEKLKQHPEKVRYLQYKVNCIEIIKKNRKKANTYHQ